jgi:hypothetical protein
MGVCMEDDPLELSQLERLAKEDPALRHAISVATEKFIGSPALAAPVERHVRRQWRDDPERRREMQEAWQAVKRAAGIP